MGQLMLYRPQHMSNYPVGPTEAERCAALQRLGILDTAPDENFNAAVELASTLFNVPIALIALLDEHREWFKAAVGWTAKEAPREWAFCNHTIYNGSVFIVPDATQDPRFAENPLVTGDPKIRFYAGVPIGLDDQHHLGTLCLIDQEARTFTESERALLVKLGRIASTFLRKLHHKQLQRALSDELGVERANSAKKEVQIRDQQTLLECATELAAIGSWEYDPTCKALTFGPDASRIFGIASNKNDARSISAMFERQDSLRWERAFSKFITRHTPLLFEGKLFTQDREEKWIRVLGKAEHNDDAVRAFGLVQDITKERAIQDQIADMAVRDSLTGLPNRIALLQQLGRLRQQSDAFCVALLDLDNFKIINDTFGHAAGDKCLRRVARRLHALASTEQLYAARIAGDEFALILSGDCSSEAISRRMARIVDVLTFSMRVNARTTNITASIGATTRPRAAAFRPDDLLSEADLALYEAKSNGRHRYALFRNEMKASADGVAQTLMDISQAIRDNEMELFYQEKRRLSDRAHAGFEALLRWRKKDGSVVAPDAFRPALEDPVLSGEICEFVVKTALDQAREWISRGHRDVSISINVGPHQFRDRQFPEFLFSEINKRHLPPSAIEIEVTEDVFIGRDMDTVLKTCHDFKDKGFHLSFDDFGTGFASLTHLLDFPVRAIKIDRSFVRRLIKEARAEGFLKAVCDLAHSLSIEVVAEGIETLEQYELLKSIGCEYGQGYFFHRPSPAREIVIKQ